MIWLLTFGLCAAVFAYIATPLYFRKLPEDDHFGPQDSVITAYREELRNVEKAISENDGDIDELRVQKSILEKRLVESAAATPDVSPVSKPIWAGATLAVLLGGTFGIYTFIGSPRLTNPESYSSATAAAQQPPAMSPTALIAEMERELQSGEEGTVRMWGLYARSLMAVGRYDDAFKAYEKALALSDNNPDIAAELESARAYAAQPKEQLSPPPAGPTAEDMAAAAQMSPEDRAAMIEAMVDSLSEKMMESPDDESGWIRLLRSRKVLGQTVQADAEIAAMKAHFADNPEIVSQILSQSGWENSPD